MHSLLVCAAGASDVTVDGSFPSLPIASPVAAHVALSSEFDEIFVGDLAAGGGVRVHRETAPGTWSLVSVIPRPPSISTSDDFGSAVAVDGDRLFVSAPDANVIGSNGDGIVFEYLRQPDGSWLSVGQFVGPASAFDDFGRRMSFDGDVGVIDDHIVERQVGGNWLPVATIPAHLISFSLGDPAAIVRDGSVFTSDGILGVAELRRQSGGGYVEVARAVLPIPMTAADEVGRSFDVSGDRMVVGTRLSDPLFANNWRAATFRRELDGDWEFVHFLSAGEMADWFGNSVAIAGDRILVSGRVDSPFTGETGVAFAYRQFGPWQWLPMGTYTSSEPFDEDLFAEWMRADGDAFVLGSDARPGLQDGAIHHVRRSSIARSNDEVSLATFGEQWVHYLGEPSFASGWFALLGSMSGTTPGFDPGFGVTLPLALDSYTVQTATGLGPFNGGQGRIDAFGRASVRIFVPNGTSPALAGIVLHHAFVVYDPDTGVFGASDPVALEIVP
jgi:hypothetical protein